MKCHNCKTEKPIAIEFLCSDGRILGLCKECSEKYLNSDIPFHGEDISKLMKKIEEK